MNQIILNFWPRQSGKSEHILKQSKENDIIICGKLAWARALEMKNKRLKFPVKQFTSISFLCQSSLGSRITLEDVWLDEFDWWTIEEQNSLFSCPHLEINGHTNFYGYSTDTASVNVRKMMRKKYEDMVLKPNYSSNDLSYFCKIYIHPNISKLFMRANEIHVSKKGHLDHIKKYGANSQREK